MNKRVYNESLFYTESEFNKKWKTGSSFNMLIMRKYKYTMSKKCIDNLNEIMGSKKLEVLFWKVEGDKYYSINISHKQFSEYHNFLNNILYIKLN